MLVESGTRSPLQELAYGEFQDALHSGLFVVGHGPTGTLLEGGDFEILYEEIGAHNAALSAPDQLEDVHLSYAHAAGKKVPFAIEAYTWEPLHDDLEALEEDLGIKLKTAERQAALNAAERAYEEDGIPRFVIDTARPALNCYYPTPEHVTEDDLYEIHKRQAEEFKAAGSTGVLLQTFPSIKEIKAAVRAFRDCEIPILGISAFCEEIDGEPRLPGSSEAGDSLQELVEAARESKAFVGVNCISRDIGVPAVKKLLEHTRGEIPLYIGLNGSTNHPRDRSKSHAEIAEEATSTESRQAFIETYKEIITLIRRANVARRAGAILATCCYTDPETTGNIAEIAEEANRGETSPASN